ncbi:MULTISPECIES: helix-turn-helix domain-containing protein [Eubacteriales]|uniref:DNA-binding transcriptional regulator, XRE family n=1 Tax=Bittarella massiliensis (ex Durand et al. 2017) TaxID=1720313 RepID=A0AAQ1RVT1_9FIRM|nr:MULTISPECIES: helix-turn-helix domain-containing protein [Eubacteriales]ERI96166.1 hypothetical protein HMPREF0262_03633 [Clostridium sp. ATCC 29733]MZL68803.1 helix-turn-helix domain-containing protein [Bittarella massiliensis (ex Durand et al. 2017)]MZL80177.1 helix-turn-helix domain-containing protein [Bittarella massiliensis (ex Durand et al. 2017)]SHG06569.1 DNA-binding transcriptional regulator, XRE family [Bittarella massiliensis (ex Durand et al. 2017)]
MFIISYAPFYKTLNKRNLKEYDLIHYYKISSNTLHRIKQGKPITTTTLDTLCSILACNVSGIINYIPGNAKGTNSPEKEGL